MGLGRPWACLPTCCNRVEPIKNCQTFELDVLLEWNPCKLPKKNVIVTQRSGAKEGASLLGLACFLTGMHEAMQPENCLPYVVVIFGSRYRLGHGHSCVCHLPIKECGWKHWQSQSLSWQCKQEHAGKTPGWLGLSLGKQWGRMSNGPQLQPCTERQEQCPWVLSVSWGMSPSL